MKKILKILITIVVITLIFLAGGVFYLFKGLETGKNVKIDGLNMSNINDGTYTGKYNSGRWSNELTITVKDKKITDIKIADDVTFSKSEVSAELFDKVIKTQNTKVDSISGATVTSKAYLKSIENALNK